MKSQAFNFSNTLYDYKISRSCLKNEIVRKLTSLTLMTIMFAGGLSVAFPGTMPQAHATHNANLFVSAENSYSNNLLTGPMVVEVVVSDSSINRLDQAVGEPDVSVNGKKLRMLQGTDEIGRASCRERVYVLV